jgi:hypothetical protein
MDLCYGFIFLVRATFLRSSRNALQWTTKGSLATKARDDKWRRDPGMKLEKLHRPKSSIRL